MCTYVHTHRDIKSTNQPNVKRTPWKNNEHFTEAQKTQTATARCRSHQQPGASTVRSSFTRQTNMRRLTHGPAAVWGTVPSGRVTARPCHRAKRHSSSTQRPVPGKDPGKTHVRVPETLESTFTTLRLREHPLKTGHTPPTGKRVAVKIQKPDY